MSDSQQNVSELKVDQTSLYREEVFTDTKVATIRRLTPVKQDGSVDKSRAVEFIGAAQVYTNMGPLPVQAPIAADNLQQAIERFPKAVERAIEQMISEVEEMRRREASRIVVADSVPGGLGGGMQGQGPGGMPGGGMPGGGKIHLK